MLVTVIYVYVSGFRFLESIRSYVGYSNPDEARKVEHGISVNAWGWGLWFRLAHGCVIFTLLLCLLIYMYFYDRRFVFRFSLLPCLYLI